MALATQQAVAAKPLGAVAAAACESEGNWELMLEEWVPSCRQWAAAHVVGFLREMATFVEPVEVAL